MVEIGVGQEATDSGSAGVTILFILVEGAKRIKN